MKLEMYEQSIKEMRRNAFCNLEDVTVIYEKHILDLDVRIYNVTLRLKG